MEQNCVNCFYLYQVCLFVECSVKILFNVSTRKTKMYSVHSCLDTAVVELAFSFGKYFNVLNSVIG